MTVDSFRSEMDEAVKNYDQYVICWEKRPMNLRRP